MTNFSLYFAKKMAWSKKYSSNISSLIIKIGQIAVALGIIIAIISVSTGIGAKRAIKEKLSDFNGHINVKGYDDNNSLDTSVLNKNDIDTIALTSDNNISSYQYYATKSGIIRTPKTFAGVVLKGVTDKYDWERFDKYIINGTAPKISKDNYSNEVLLSQKTANELQLKTGDSFVIYFINQNDKPIYRKLTISGIYKTDIKNIDDVFIIGDIKHIQKINQWTFSDYGGMEIYTKDIENIDHNYKTISQLVGATNYAETPAMKYEQIVSWVDLFDMNILVILVIMMFVVAINMVMVLLILIIERTPSIGVLKTLGANNGQIRNLFINYTLMIMLPGLLFGNIIGVGILLIQKYFEVIKLDPENYFISSVPVYINPVYILLISVFTLIISGIVLLLPSYLISKISPAKAINFD